MKLVLWTLFFIIASAATDAQSVEIATNTRLGGDMSPSTTTRRAAAASNIFQHGFSLVRPPR